MSIKEVMPYTARKIIQFRRDLGAARADALLLRAVGGEPGIFLSLENHRSFGTPPLSNHICTWRNGEHFYRVADPPWMNDAIDFALTLGIEIEVRDLSDFDEAIERGDKLRNILRRVSYGK